MESKAGAVVFAAAGWCRAVPSVMDDVCHGAISRLSGFNDSTWSATDFTITNMGTARIVPHAPQIHVHNSTPRKTTTTCIRSALPISAGFSNHPRVR